MSIPQTSFSDERDFMPTPSCRLGMLSLLLIVSLFSIFAACSTILRHSESVVGKYVYTQVDAEEQAGGMEESSFYHCGGKLPHALLYTHAGRSLQTALRSNMRVISDNKFIISMIVLLAFLWVPQVSRQIFRRWRNLSTAYHCLLKKSLPVRAGPLSRTA